MSMIAFNDTSATVAAAGSDLAGATKLKAKFNNVTTVAASAGVALPANAPVGAVVHVRNAGANALAVYPATAAGTIAGGSAGASVSLATTTDKTKNSSFIHWGSDVWTQVISG